MWTRAAQVSLFLAAVLPPVVTAEEPPPRVVSLVPADGATDVAPHARFIRVEFDQDMSEGSHSWVGGGDRFPRIRGCAYWDGPRVAVLPVALEPEREYRLSLNSDRFRGFASRSGVPLVPVPLAFRTGPAVPHDAAAEARAENAAAVPVLRRTIDRYYSYRDRLKVDWAAAFAEAEPRLASAASPAEFAERAAELLGRAGDLHVTLECEGRVLATHTRAVTPNGRRTTLARIVPEWQEPSAVVATGRWPDGVGYILIASWERGQAEALDPAFAALDEFADAPALIIDARFNAGGDEELARRFAGCFAARPTLYARSVIRTPDQRGGWSPPQSREVVPTRGRPRWRGPVAVLMGPYCMSSNESFLLMMRHGADATLVGTPSFGSSGNPRPYGLPNGVVVYLPSWKDLLPDGTPLEGKGIQPDVPVAAEPGAFEDADPVLEAALRHVRAVAESRPARPSEPAPRPPPRPREDV